MTTDSLLAVDIGNSFTHFGLFQRRDLIMEMSLPTEKKRQWKEKEEKLFGYFLKKTKNSILASVVPGAEMRLKERLLKRGKRIYSLRDGLFTGLEIDYGEKDSPLGEDRICAASGVVWYYRKSGLIVDLGTATTFSGVTRDGRFLGGVIAPGISSSLSFLKRAERLSPFASLFLKTNFPLPKVNPPYLAKNTKEGLRNGIYLSIKSFLEGMIKNLKAEMPPDTLVFLTGGQSNRYRYILEGIDIFDPFLNLRGLYALYHLNKRRRHL